MKQQDLIFVLICSFYVISCFDDIGERPPCFIDGDIEGEGSEVNLNVCCEPGSQGDNFCKDTYKERGEARLSELAQCTDQGYCRLCEIGVSCACLGNRDCEEGTSCTVTDNAMSCGEQLSSFEGQRCAICL